MHCAGRRCGKHARHRLSRAREISAVRVARGRLLLEPIELAVEDGALKLPQAIVARDHVMLVPDPPSTRPQF